MWRMLGSHVHRVLGYKGDDLMRLRWVFRKYFPMECTLASMLLTVGKQLFVKIAEPKSEVNMHFNLLSVFLFQCIFSNSVVDSTLFF